MEDALRRKYELRTELFKALAHPMRLHLLELLRDRPWCVCELAAAAGIDKSVASKHLSQLKAVGLISDERRGTLVEYRLEAPCVLDTAACAEAAALRSLRGRLRDAVLDNADKNSIEASVGVAEQNGTP